MRHHRPGGNGLLKAKEVRMELTTIAVDVAKSVFQVAISSRHGSVDAERRLSRDRFLTFFVQQPAATVLWEACAAGVEWPSSAVESEACDE